MVFLYSSRLLNVYASQLIPLDIFSQTLNFRQRVCASHDENIRELHSMHVVFKGHGWDTIDSNVFLATYAYLTSLIIHSKLSENSWRPITCNMILLFGGTVDESVIPIHELDDLSAKWPESIFNNVTK